MSLESKKYLYEVDLNSASAPAKILRLVGTGKKVLEIGCASGTQSKILKDTLYCCVTGIEINSEAAAQARAYCDTVIVGDLNELDLEKVLGNEKFDVVMFADVLEHLRDPKDALKKVMPFLANGGYLLASIPNIVHIAVIMEMVRGRFDYRDWGLLDDTHIHFFTLKSIFNVFEMSGYRITLLDRVVIAPEDTEFAVKPENEQERLIFGYIEEANPEYQTFQFIVRASISDGVTPFMQAQVVGAQKETFDLERQLAEANEKIHKLESELNWIQSRPAYRLFAALKNHLLIKS